MQNFDGNPPLLGAAGRAYHTVFGWAQRLITHDVLALFVRLTIAGVFWRSLLTKVQTFGLFSYTELINDFPVERFHLKLPVLPLDLRPAIVSQFENDFALPIIPGDIAAWMATLGEFVLPLMLVFGILTRFAAAGLLAMTLVIQIFVFPNAWWSDHALWAALLLYLVARGGGRFTADFAAGRALTRMQSRD